MNRRFTETKVAYFRDQWRRGKPIGEIAGLADVSLNAAAQLLYGTTYRDIAGAVTREERIRRHGDRARRRNLGK